MHLRSQPDFEASMEELTRLGSLLGMPNIFDPMFPLAYSAFFGGAEEARLGIKMETDHDPKSVKSSNVSIIYCDGLLGIPLNTGPG